MEVLGGVASVAGVTSLAIQVCEELKKAYDFWQSVKEAPDEIAHISTEIKILMTWLTIIANNYQRQRFSDQLNETAAIDTLSKCLETAQNMNNEVRDLEPGFSRGVRSRRWASVKFVFRKNKNNKMMGEIERIKTHLIIVQNFHNGEMQEAGFRSLTMILLPKESALQATGHEQSPNLITTASEVQDLVTQNQSSRPKPDSPAEMVSSRPTAPSQAARRPKYRTTHQESRTYNFGLAMLQLVEAEQESILTNGSGNQGRLPKRRTRYDLRIVQWLLSRGFSWQSFGVYGNWQHSFRTFRYIARNARVVKLCRRGDVPSVQKMFEQKMASPYDRVVRILENGRVEEWSLLHYSIFYGHPYMCKFLIECGLGCGTASGMSRHPILSLVAGQTRVWKTINPAAHIDIMRIMVIDGQYDPMEGNHGASVMHGFKGSPEVYRWLLAQEEFLIDFEQRTNRHMTIANSILLSPLSNASKFLEAVLTYRVDDVGSPRSRFVLSLWELAPIAVICFCRGGARYPDFSNRMKLLWNAGVDFHIRRSPNLFGSTIDFLVSTIVFNMGEREWLHSGVLPPLSAEGLINSCRLEDTSTIEYRPRVSRSLWHTWHPGDELPILEVVQRHLDAWMEALLEAGLDIADYGRQEDQLHPGGLVRGTIVPTYQVKARLHFEYGDHVNGCRIHVTEIWIYKDDDSNAASSETPTMPCSWDFDK